MIVKAEKNYQRYFFEVGNFQHSEAKNNNDDYLI